MDPFLCLAAPLTGRNPPNHQGKFDVFAHRQPGKKIAVLGDESDILVQTQQFFPLEQGTPSSAADQTAGEAEKRGFAASRGTDDGRKLVPIDRQLHVVQYDYFVTFKFENFTDVLKLYDRRGASICHL
jgi:hypothetical protein